MCDKPCPSIWIVRTWSPGPVRKSNNIGWLFLGTQPQTIKCWLCRLNYKLNHHDINWPGETKLVDRPKKTIFKKMKMVWNYSRPVSKYLHALALQIGRPTPGLGRGKILQKLSHLAHNPQACTLIFPSFTKKRNSSYVHSWMYPITSHCQLGESM